MSSTPPVPLRAALEAPTFDTALVARLGALASRLDGGMRNPEAASWVAEFNREASTDFKLAVFQGVYGAMRHEAWVRTVLARPLAESTPVPTDAEMIEIVRRVMAAEGDEGARAFWLRVLETHLHPRASDLLYWPGEFFGDGDDRRKMTPEEVVTAARADEGARRAD